MAFTSPISLFVAVLIVIALFVMGWIRRPALPRMAMALAMGGVILLALSAGGISCQHGREAKIAVMVDCSPSTRGASFRDPKWLRSRIRELLGSRPFDLYAFAETSRKLGDNDPIAEMPADQTVLSPPAGLDAVLLFSDGRFDSPPVTPPMNIVIDPALSSPQDAAIVSLEQRGDELAASVSNTGPPRELNWMDGHRQSTTAPTGSTVLSTRRDAMNETITARLNAGDQWPENDALSIRPSPPIASQKWWIGESAPNGWMGFSPANLPAESSAWLGPAIVLMNDVPADAIAPPAQDRLTQYARDLGGSLVIAGGEHAFAAGHYAGSELETLSPLSSSPPEPVTHWVLLVDASGSMSAPAGASTRFRVTADSMASVLRELPKSDLVSIGSFARELNWWAVAKKAQDASLQTLPPPDVQPGGPTNLESALRQIIAKLPASPPIDLLVLSDAEAEISDTAKLGAELSTHHIRLSALIVGASAPASGLSNLATATGGQIVRETDAAKWTQEARRMLRSAMPDQLVRRTTTVTFAGILNAIAPQQIELLNRTWIKTSATSLATADGTGEKMPAAAQWKIGSGDVVAIAFPPRDEEISAIEQAIARRPRDPRFGVEWRNGSTLHIRIDAIDRGDYLNDQKLTLQLAPDSKMPIPQTGPGRYEIDLPAPRTPVTVSILHDGQLLDRFAIAGRYPREFDAVGNDPTALRALADRSGGRVIAPDDHSLIDFPETRQIRSLASIFAILGALLIAGALIAWRIL